jgi:hypothetical protein
MALLHLHQDHHRGFASACGTMAKGAFRCVRAALGRIHLAIVAAKLQRLRTELMLQRDYGRSPEQDVAKYPQWPLIVPDKWDF